MAGLSRRRFVGGVALTALGAACADDGGGTAVETTTSAAPTTGPASTTADASDDARPNVLYVAVDDLGTQLGAYGHPNVTSPRIDAFAADNTLFSQCFVQIPICGPSRTSILLGLRPETTRVLRNEDPWATLYAEPAASLPRHFRDHGYRTLGLGKINDARNGPLDDAWDVAPSSPNISGPDEVEAWLDDVAGSAEPFFAAIGFNQTHCEWTPSDDALSQYSEADVAAEIGPVRQVPPGYLRRCAPDLRPGIENESAPTIELTDAEAQTIARDYLAAVTDVDTAFGELLDAAESRGLLDNTIVIFWSGDHGYTLGHHLWGKWRPYDRPARIPLVIALPESMRRDNSPPERIDGLIEALDMYPTLMDLCGLPQPPQPLEGQSFAGALSGQGDAGKEAVYSRFERLRSVRTAEWFYLANDFWGIGTLFNRADDPEELNDVAAANPEVVEQMVALLDATSPVLTS